ncbi:protein FAR1-RELATED SEQUENCE 5-like [Chenopodium quinoa]|uniref:protein FAR1-RELATED SEQUENCE 5-like n=1 Tax=Chenopodium quinoa TaxID=63459 RepID=UPI000B78FD18|nr:protein FAR1-RELATED SEQUENCE 5-like [Chenopodium quinoa]
MRKQVRSDSEAYEMYNDYAFRHEFSIRRGKNQYVGNWRGRNYLCSNAGVWTVVKHNMDHNHAMIPTEKRHLLRSQRKIQGEHLKFISTMKTSGVRVSDSLRSLRKEAGGSPNLCFTSSDAYNALATEKAGRLDCCDCNTLIKYFAASQAKEFDFYYEFEVDVTRSLTSVFWRDGRLRRDHEVFGDLMVFDTTYRTNKYGMICAPFVGMNHHCNNVMFGMGFVLDEKTSSFIWLFEAFMRSMGGCRHPAMLMTDQAPSIAAAIREIFPSTRHRLCTWHLGENSKTNIGALRILKGFSKVFDYLLKYCECPAEFELYWPRVRSKESEQDFRFLRGNLHLAVANDQFAKRISCSQEWKHEDDETICYYVWRPNKDIIRHEVTYEKFTFNINCT